MTICGATNTTELKNLSLNGGIEDGKARLIIEGFLNGSHGDKQRAIFATSLEQSIKISQDAITQSINATFNVLEGNPGEFALTLSGQGEIRQVTGKELQDWSMRQETNNIRTLVLRRIKSYKPAAQFLVNITAESELKDATTATPLSLIPTQPALLSGYVKIDSTPELLVQAGDISGLIPITPKFLPPSLGNEPKPGDPEPLSFRFQGTAYSLPLQISLADPETRRVVLKNFKLLGQLHEQTAAFTLTATAHVKNPKGGSISLLSGAIALTVLEQHPGWHVRFEQDRFLLVFDQPGEFPIQLKFNAAVRQNEGGWKALDFHVTPSSLQPIVLEGLAADTQFQFPGAARPERKGAEFVSYLPSDGAVRFSWKESRPEAEGKLFYSTEMLSQINVSPGLMRQVALLDFKVMQGELSRLGLILRGAGEVTRVQGEQVLAWNVEPIANSTDRRLVVQFNQPQKNQFALQVHMQTPLGAFPQTADSMQLRPEDATRFAGYFRIVNEGAVRLEVVQSTGLSQISPEQFPESETTRAAFRASGSQKFAYRFSGADFSLRLQADQILPELTVSELLAYRLGENELSIDAEIELEIREAPLRELLLRVPKGYAIARLSASGLSDYFLREPEDQTEAELRLVYGQPTSGRQVLQLRLERNKPLGETTWNLPRIEVAKAKSVRGHIAATSDEGFRLTAERTQALTEIATAFFPRKVAGIQAAFRLTDPAWQLSVRVERLPQTLQADVFHLFSIGEGIAYGSSIINYVISGAPVSAFKVELSDEYFNVEFTGKDIRTRQKIAGGYMVQLHTPVSGAYTLLATYERPFKAQGETLGFAGARPLDSQTEQGHTIIISAYQFQVKPVDVSSGLLPLETGEVPSEYRLFFDAPILAAYRYNSRPFNLRLALSPLAQGDSVSQVVDRAALVTHISKEGQVLTDARYFVKNRGNPNFRLSLPAGTELWSATVNGLSVVPVMDASSNLISLPQQLDPNAVLTLDLKLASKSGNAKRISVGAPIVNAPVLFAEWKLEPDTNQRLLYRQGSLTPVGGVPDVSGFAELARTFGGEGNRATTLVLGALALIGCAIVVWRWTLRASLYRFSGRHLLGTGLGLIACVIALGMFFNLADLASRQQQDLPREVSFLAPVQQAGSTLSVQLSNIPDKVSVLSFLGSAWPALFALTVWFYGWLTVKDWFKTVGGILGWTLLAWAALRYPNGAPAFFVVILAFLIWYVLISTLRQLWHMPPKPQPAPAPETGSASAVAGILLCGFFCLGYGRLSFGSESSYFPAKSSPISDSIAQTIRIEETFAIANAHIRWQAGKGQMLPLLFEPAVLIGIKYPTNALKLVQAQAGTRRSQQILAQDSGVFEIEMQYQTQVSKHDNETGFNLPTQFGVVNSVELTVANLDVDVLSAQAVSLQRIVSGSNTVAKLVLTPVNDVRIAWKPRSRDVKSEKPVFYADLSQLYVPTAGVIEGVHYISIRPAQGELNELILDVPQSITITDVTETSKAASIWRFDPDTRKLRITRNPPESRPFGVIVRSQITAGPLPFEHSVGLLNVQNAAGQIGLLGIGTGNEVTLDSVTAESFSPINLEDFPGELTTLLQAQIPALTVRRAFRYSDSTATVSLKASAVEPDVRVETQDTVSLGEDRTILAANPTVTITRAGVFKLSFLMPSGFDVESISGQSLSHWTEMKTDAGRLITLHLKGKTEGQQQFAISLAGPGLKATNNWPVPQLSLREASKQRGTLVLVPEQGMRLQVAASEGITQLDPQKSGIRQKGVLAFRLLQAPWSLALALEQVDAWIQVTSLQHATVNEALLKVLVNLQYQIENTGLKSFQILIPTNAENVRFQGEQVADFLKVPNGITNGLQQWEVKLHRRMLGTYLLQATYQTPVPERASETILRGVEALNVNLQRGFLTVQSAGRLQTRIDTAPEALQPTEWQSIPRALQQDLHAVAANYTYRLVEPSYQLPLKLERHEAAKLLAARVNNINFSSVISDDGIMLTQVRLEMIPGDKRLLNLTLPKDSRFWFAFVNQNGVWPWRDQDRILIPLEQSRPAGRGEQVVPVEFFFSCPVGIASHRSLDLELLAPKFDLPLENLTWRVALSDKWKVTHWSGTLQLQQEEMVFDTASTDLQTYLQNETSLQTARTKEAETFLAAGNSALEKGDPQQARRAFQAAYGLSTHDAAFNEDARVQLHNIKLQQALVGLNVRQATASGDQAVLGGKLRDLRSHKEANYTQQDAKDIIDRNNADDNAAYMRLAEKLIQQQDAAVTTPAAIHATVPVQGRVLTFKRAVVVDQWANLGIQLQATAVKAANWATCGLILAGTFLLLAVLAWSRSVLKSEPHG